MASIVLSGMVAADPYQGGATWAVLQYALGLQRLGHEVTVVEPVHGGEPPIVGYFEQVVAEFGLCAALLVRGTRETVGLGYGELRRRARGADLLLNINGLLAEEG